MSFFFKSASLSFRQLKNSDKELYISLYTDPIVMQYIAEPLSKTTAARMFEAQLKPWGVKSTHMLNLVITEISSDLDIGVCGVVTRSLLSKQAEVGMVFLPEFHSKGYGTETLTRLSKYAFKELGYNKLSGPPFPSNKASIKIMQKSGYKFEATLRQNQFLNGKYHDTPFYTLLKDECTYLD
ncbi:GNAT family N-acetyltransferase [Kangiella sp. HZ709]|uniref:GNAT family N-acetyltransferase n=1 Tax=Kangiella sp. HZ709 TaxID=2666328 RepID=UPI0012B00291|nr:GNAT family protein [Kangiella sp. HZ709]MRX27682.1 GNAT family N-acetyltransferase [Kangiella sp. HZ709]